MHWARRAASRADWTAGKSKAMRTAMMAMTTRSSIRVNPGKVRRRGLVMDEDPTRKEGEDDARKNANHGANCATFAT